MNQRVLKLLDTMLKSDGYISLKELAEVIEMSVPTVRLDIERAELFLCDKAVQIQSKRGVGLKLVGETANLLSLKSLIQEMSHEYDQHPTELDYNILTFLLQNINQVVTINEIATEFYLSDSSVQQKITSLKPMLNSFEVDLKAIQGKGIFVEGNESHIRRLYAQVLFRENEHLKGYSEPEKLRTNIFQMLNLNPDPIFEAIKQSEVELGTNFTDESFQSLAIHIAIALKRVFDGVSVDHVEIDTDQIIPDAYTAAVNLYRTIEKAYRVSFDDSEIYYVYLHLISTRINSDENMSLRLNRGADVVATIASNIMYLVQDIKKVRVKEEYLTNLMLHLRPAINRLEYRMELKNPLLQKIKKEYPEAFGIAWMCNPIFVREVDRELPEDEVAYLALHIQAMIESTKTLVKAMIVCSSGIGISQLLRTQIESKFTNLEILDIDSVMDYKRNDMYRKTDFIISTFPIDADKPVIIVNPILSIQDVESINYHINDMRETIPNEALIRHVFIHPQLENRAEVINHVSDFLYENDYVDENFKESVFKREAIYSTEIGNYVALPHGGSPYVKTSQLIVVILKDPIMWDEFEVDIIIFILITEEEKRVMTDKLKRVYKKLYTDEFRDALKGAKNREEVLRLF